MKDIKGKRIYYKSKVKSAEKPKPKEEQKITTPKKGKSKGKEK